MKPTEDGRVVKNELSTDSRLGKPASFVYEELEMIGFPGEGTDNLIASIICNKVTSGHQEKRVLLPLLLRRCRLGYLA